MASQMGNVVREIREAVMKAAIRSDSGLPHLPLQHKTQLASMARRVRGQDRYDGKPSSTGGPSTSWKDTNRKSNSKRTYYDTDSGRPVRETGRINEDFGSSRRGDNATAVGHIGGKGFDGGHLGAHRFFGDTPDEGIVPQASNLNRGPWRKMESEWADWANAGFRVDYTISVQPPGADVPDSFSVNYRVTDPNTGNPIHQGKPRFDNSDGQSFDRIPRGDIEGLASNGG